MVFVNDFSPFVFQIPGTEFGIRWYGLAYVLGFVYSYFVLKRAIASGQIRGLDEKGLETLLFVIMGGVVIGGRLGWCVQNMGDWVENPMLFFQFQRGGMAFFGGLIGILLGFYLFCRAKGVSYGQLTDAVTLPAAVSLGIGRIANFINAELWGIPTGGDWGVIYPNVDQTPRHPSELYEMTSHFLLALVLVLAGRIPAVRERPGVLACVFVVGYGFFRFFTEIYRTADTYVGPLTNGQVASLVILVVGLVAGGIVWKRSGKQAVGE